MSRYNEVYQCTWDSENFKSLSKPEPNAQTLWLFILTGKIRTPLPGIYNVGLGALEDFLKWSRKSLTECFRELSQNDMAKVDLDNNVIYLPNWFKWNKPQNPNVLKGWINLLDNIPNCEYKYLYCQQLKSLVKSLDKPFHKVLGESFGTPEPEPVLKPKPEIKPKPIKKANVEIPDHLKEIWPSFLEMRNKKKKPATEYAQSLVIKQLDEFYPGNTEKQIECLNKSIINSWTDVFEIKNQDQFGNSKKVLGTKYSHLTEEI